MFRFIGFEPSGDLKSLTKEILWLVEEKSPGHSARTAILEKNGSQYIGSIKVSSTSGVFSAEASNEDPQNVVNELYKKIKQDLVFWQKNRPDFA